MQAVAHAGKVWYDEEFIKEAVDIVIGDDGFRGREVIKVLKALYKEAQE